MNAVQHFASHSFSNYALKNIRIDEDHAGLFASVPSSDGRWYTVRCVESKTSVYASHCNCSSFAKHQHCTHVEVTQKYWRRFYKPALVKVEAPVKEVAKVVKVRKPRNGLVRKQRNGGLVKVEQTVAKVIEQPAKVIEQPAKVTVQPVAKITGISTLGNLSSNQGFRLLR
jgi:hypothetical protein